MNKGLLSIQEFARLVDEYHGNIMNAMNDTLPRKDREESFQNAYRNVGMLMVEANSIEHSIGRSFDQAKKSLYGE